MQLKLSYLIIVPFFTKVDMESVPLDMEDILGAEADFDEAQLPDIETELEPMRAEGDDADPDGEDGAGMPDTGNYEFLFIILLPIILQIHVV